MNKLIILIFSIGLTCTLAGQQDVQFTQFMFNKLAYNPAYAGSQETPNLTLLYRSQWTGITGAPESQSISFHAPFFNNRVGIGLSLLNDEIGPTQSVGVGTSYAYRVGLNDGFISFGLRANLRNYRINWNNVVTTHLNDFLIEAPNNSELLLNVGVGIYYENDKMYIGLSIPNLHRGELSLLGKDIIPTTDVTALESRHVYLMASYLFDLSSDIIFKPAVLLKHVQNAPFDMDANASFIYKSTLWAGISYRLGGSTVQGFGESIDYLLQYQLSHNFRAGIAYDQTLSELKDFNSGTFELIAHYNFKTARQKATNPRFF